MNKKDLIMDSAMKLFLKKGFANVSNADIIKKSNVGSGTMYYYFNDKDDLILSTINKYILEMLTERLNIVKKFDGDSRSTLEYMFRQIIGCDNENEIYIIPVDCDDYSFQKVALLACEGIQKYEQVSEKYKEFNDKFVEYIEYYIENGKKNNEIRNDIETDELSHIIQTNINGIFFMNMIQDNIDLNKFIEANLFNLWNFIKK